LLLSADGKNFDLASGRKSHFLFDIKPIALDPIGSNLIAELILETIDKDTSDFIGGMETGAIPIVSAVVVRSKEICPLPGFFVRKQAKERGTKRRVDGNLAPGSTAVLLDDVTTTGGSVLEAVDVVRNFGCFVSQVITVVDRLEGARENLAAAGIELTALFTKEDFGL